MTDSIGSDTATKEPTETEAPAAAEVVAEVIEDLEVILPQPGEPLVLGQDSARGEYRVVVNRLRTREFLALMRFLTAGVGPAIAEIDFGQDQAELTGELIALLVVGVAEADQEFVGFVQAIVQPVGTSDEEQARVISEMRNPSLDDMLLIAERLAVQEAPDLQRLLGKVQAMWANLSKVYAKHPIGGSGARSPRRST